jgi:hypothetical protein
LKTPSESEWTIPKKKKAAKTDILSLSPAKEKEEGEIEGEAPKDVESPYKGEVDENGVPINCREHNYSCDCCKRIWFTNSFDEIDKLIGYKNPNAASKDNLSLFCFPNDKSISSQKPEYTQKGLQGYLLELFYRTRFFGGRHKKDKAQSFNKYKERDALHASWNAFIRNCQMNVKDVAFATTLKESRYYKHSPVGRQVMIHKICHIRQLACAVPMGVYCPMCPNENSPRISRTSALFPRLPEEAREAAKELFLEHQNKLKEQEHEEMQYSSSVKEVKVEETRFANFESQYNSETGGFSPAYSVATPKHYAEASKASENPRTPARRQGRHPEATHATPTSRAQASIRANARDTPVVSYTTSSQGHRDDRQPCRQDICAPLESQSKEAVPEQQHVCDCVRYDHTKWVRELWTDLQNHKKRISEQDVLIASLVQDLSSLKRRVEENERQHPPRPHSYYSDYGSYSSYSRAPYLASYAMPNPPAMPSYPYPREDPSPIHSERKRPHSSDTPSGDQRKT